MPSHLCFHYLCLILIHPDLYSEVQVGRVKTVVADGVKEIWLSSEDTGAYGM